MVAAIVVVPDVVVPVVVPVVPTVVPDVAGVVPAPVPVPVRLGSVITFETGVTLDVFILFKPMRRAVSPPSLFIEV